MKKFSGKFLPVALAAVIVCVGTAFAADVFKNLVPVTVDGKKVEIETVTFEQRTYFKLTDLNDKLGLGLGLTFDGNVNVSTVPEVPETHKKSAVFDSKLSAGSWGEFRGVDVKEVLFVSNVEKNSVEAFTGWFVEPSGEDKDEADYQFTPIKGNYEARYGFAEGVKFFWNWVGEPAEITAAEFAEKVAIGYEIWEAEYKDGKITKLSSVAWQEKIVYKIVGVKVYDGYAAISAKPIKMAIAPFLLDNYRFTDLGFPIEVITLTEDTKFDFGVYIEPQWSEKWAGGGFALSDLARFYGDYPHYAVIEKIGVRAVSVAEVFIP